MSPKTMFLSPGDPPRSPRVPKVSPRTSKVAPRTSKSEPPGPRKAQNEPLNNAFESQCSPKLPKGSNSEPQDPKSDPRRHPQMDFGGVQMSENIRETELELN